MKKKHNTDSSETTKPTGKGEVPQVRWTPGPWAYQEQSGTYTHIVRKGNRFITQLGQDTTGTEEANARLIAAAPELYEALAEAERALHGIADWALGGGGMISGQRAKVYNYIGDRLEKARAALAKARGEIRRA